MLEAFLPNVKGQALRVLESERSLLSPPSECPCAPGFTGARRVRVIFLLGGLLTVLHAVPALAGKEFSPSSVEKVCS